MSRTLLVADDSVTIQKVVELTFSDGGHRVVGVGDGRAALETARELRPDLVLCDVIMPEMNGYEVCQQLKADPLTADTPVLLLTGAFEPFDEERARSCGADGHLTKPFESRVLLSRVEELLAGSGSGPETDSGHEAPAPEASSRLEADAEPLAAEFEPRMEERHPEAPAERDRPALDPAGWGEESEPEAIVFEPLSPGGEAEADDRFAPEAEISEAGDRFVPEPEAGAPFAPELEIPKAPAVAFGETEDWLEPKVPAPPLQESPRAIFSPEPPREAPFGSEGEVCPPFDENPIVLDEDPADELSTPVFPAAGAPASDSPAPFDLAHALADPSLRRMVEEAVERVVREVVREVAWEIVPDLTESALRQPARDDE